MSCGPGDVSLVVYRPPTSGKRRTTKSRPMVVVSSDQFHTERPQDLLAALVTTKIGKYRGTTDYALRDWDAAGLHQPSVVRATLATVEHAHIGGRVGHLSEEDLHGVTAALTAHYCPHIRGSSG